MSSVLQHNTVLSSTTFTLNNHAMELKISNDCTIPLKVSLQFCVRLHFRSPQLHMVCRLQAEHLDKGPIATGSGEKRQELKMRIMHTRAVRDWGYRKRQACVLWSKLCVYDMCGVEHARFITRLSLRKE